MRISDECFNCTPSPSNLVQNGQENEECEDDNFVMLLNLNYH